MAASGSMVLEMIDWRNCPVIEYAPDRVSGAPSFLGMRMPVDILVSWTESGQRVKDFDESCHVGEQNIRVALEYLQNDPPVHTVDLTGCPAVERGQDGRPVFIGTEFPVEILFNHMKGGIAPRAFADKYGLDYAQIKWVLKCDLRPVAAG